MSLKGPDAVAKHISKNRISNDKGVFFIQKFLYASLSQTNNIPVPFGICSLHIKPLFLEYSVSAISTLKILISLSELLIIKSRLINSAREL